MLKDAIQQAILTNLKAKNESALKALRFFLSEINYAKIQKGSELTDEETQALLVKEVKKRKEAIAMFEKAGRTELVDEEKKQLETFAQYLPKQLPHEEIEKIVDDVIGSIKDIKNPGQVIGQVMARVKGQASGDEVATIVRKKLSAS